MTKQKKIYLASGWFTPEQSAVMWLVARSLRAQGFDVLMPIESTQPGDITNPKHRQKCFKDNVDHIHSADYVVACTTQKDMGTLMECGIAYEAGIPLIIVAYEIKGGCNLMLTESAIKVCTNLDEIDSLGDWLNNYEKTGKREIYNGDVE